jgi:hypothetical protein
VVLVRISIPMRENQFWIHRTLDLLKTLLHLVPIVGKKSISKILENYPFVATGSKELGCLTCLLTAKAGGTENDPVKSQLWKNSFEMQQCCTAADLNVVGMGAKAKHREGLRISARETQTNHATCPATG